MAATNCYANTCDSIFATEVNGVSDEKD